MEKCCYWKTWMNESPKIQWSHFRGLDGSASHSCVILSASHQESPKGRQQLWVEYPRPSQNCLGTHWTTEKIPRLKLVTLISALILKEAQGCRPRFCSVEGKHVFWNVVWGHSEKKKRVKGWKVKVKKIEMKSQGVDSELCSNMTKSRRGYEDELYKKGTWTSLKEERLNIPRLYFRIDGNS